MNGPELPEKRRIVPNSASEPEPIFIEHDFLDDPAIHLPCYEPAGASIDLSVKDLSKHLLICGASGSGKTSILSRIIENLIRYRTSTTDAPAGLLILDAQGDGAISRIRNMAAKAGRLGDVRVLSKTEGFFSPLAGLASFADLDMVVSSLMSATNITTSMKENDSYWSENTRLLIESGLTILLLTEHKIDFHHALNFLSALFAQGSQWSDETKARVGRFERLIDEAESRLSSGIRSKLCLIRATLVGWRSLDSRTRGILQSCIGLALSPFLSAQALPYWDSNKGDQVHPADALEGKIVVLSVRGSAEPETAMLLSRLVKIAFYRAAQSRTNSIHHPLAGIVMDEFPLCVTSGSPRWSDINALATLRGKGVFVVAATQGLVNLDLIIGAAQTQALLTNFSSVIFLRSQETGFLYSFAEKILGNKEIVPRTNGIFSEIGDMLHPDFSSQETVSVCPPGALARLETHQAYVALANGYRTLKPFWLAPLFFPHLDTAEEPPLDRDLFLLRSADRETQQTALPSSSGNICSLQLYHVLLAHPRRVRTAKVMTAQEFLAGLRGLKHLVGPVDTETIPAAWRKACLRMAAKLPKGLKIVQLSCEEGTLSVTFVAPFIPSHQIDFSDFQRRSEQWKQSVYPSRIRAPHRRDLLWIENNFPGLLADSGLNSSNKKANQSIEDKS